MIPVPLQLLIALALDALIGDPHGWPHPVRLIASLALNLEKVTRASIKDERIAGILTALLVMLATGSLTYCIVRIGGLFHPLLGDIISILIIYAGIAAQDLAKHARSVQDALVSKNLDIGRKRVGMICGRDTDTLNEIGVTKATIESVAENTVDGVTAPLFYGMLVGPVGVMVYKAISTLDSTFGYKNDRYWRFGWASARMDDLAAFVPSRLTSFLVPIAAWINNMRSLDSFMVLKRDRLRHASPNSGHTEAAFAGALGLRLGGPGYYQGALQDKPFIGDPVFEPNPQAIAQSVRLMYTTTVISFCALSVMFFLLEHI